MTFFFALAGCIYAYDKKWGIGFLIATTLMGFARIMAGVHYPADVLAGAAIGLGVAWAISLYSLKKRFHAA